MSVRPAHDRGGRVRVDGDLDEEVGHAPQQRHRREEQPGAGVVPLQHRRHQALIARIDGTRRIARTRAAALEGPAQRHLVGVLEVAADGQAGGEARDPDLERRQQAAEVGRGRLALEVGVGREDDLLHGAVGEALHQRGDAQVVGTDAGDRADRAAEHVVEPAELAGALDRRDVLGVFDDADERRVATGVAADRAARPARRRCRRSRRTAPSRAPRRAAARGARRRRTASAGCGT